MELNATHDPQRRSWIESANEPDNDFPIQNLPFGAFECANGEVHLCVAIGDHVLDLFALYGSGLLTIGSDAAIACQAATDSTLNRLMSMDPRYASALRAELSGLLDINGPRRNEVYAPAEVLLPRRDQVKMCLPVAVGDYTDFLTSLHHTERHGRYKGLADPLPPAFKSLPIAYHGRASSLRVSGGNVRRPNGQYRDRDGEVVFGPAPMMDYELEFAAWIGHGNVFTQPVPIDSAQGHIFGYSLLNDWSAKSIQWFEQVLGPFLGKSFHSSLSPWIVTAEALAPFRKAPPKRGECDPPIMPHLNGKVDQQQGSFNIDLYAHLSTPQLREGRNGPVQITHTHLDNLYWTFAQMVAHHTSNGCNLRTGDLLGSGTVSGSADEARACLTELTNGGRDPLHLPNGETRTSLEDGDEIILSARATQKGKISIGFGECRGQIAPAFGLLQ